MSKSRQTFTRLALAAAAACTVSAAAFAHGTPDVPRDGRPGAHAQHMGHPGARHMAPGDFAGMRGLNLTEAQRDQIFNIRHASAPDARQAMKEVAEARKAMRELAGAGQFDEAKAKAAADREGAAIAKASLLRAKTQSQIHAVLTPEQRQQLEQKRDRKRGPGKGPQAAKPAQ